MAYNNYFPMGYQPMYYPQQTQPIPPAQPMPQQSQQTPTQQTMNSGIIWVQGEAGAKSYLVAPNTAVQLWDSERQTIYIKSADASGMPSMKVLDYTIRENSVSSGPSPVSMPSNAPAYALKDDVDVLYRQIAELRSVIDGMNRPVKTAPKKKEDAENV